MIYAKLENSELIYAPPVVKIGRTNYIPPPASWLEENGYKPVHYTEEPTEDGKYAVSHWAETESEIMQEWELIPLPDEIQNDEIIRRLEEIL